jgi:D-apiose dehydrogenase
MANGRTTKTDYQSSGGVMEKRLKGIGIGAGYFSAFHYDAWARLKDKVDMTAIFASEAKAMADRFAIAEAHDRKALEAELDRIQPDFVDIIAPPPAHKSLVELFASRGIAIMCQKPLGRNFAEAQEIAAIVEAAGIPFMVHENWRWQPWYRELAKLVGDGKPLGQIHSIASNVRLGDGWPEDAYMARQPYFRDYPRLFIFETGVHFLDTYRFLGGEIESVHARIQRRNPGIKGEDAAQIVCGFANGATAILDASRYNESEHDNARYTFGTMRVDCANGHARFDEDGRIWVKQLGQPVQEHAYPRANSGFAGDCVYTTIEHFITELAGGRNFETDAASYLKTLELVEACYRSADENKVIML